jgi:hypothetical protein
MKDVSLFRDVTAASQSAAADRLALALVTRRG